MGKEVMDAGNMCTVMAKRWRERLRFFLFVGSRQYSSPSISGNAVMLSED
jgi:hypothetical protein